jgi:hypothetical protein
MTPFPPILERQEGRQRESKRCILSVVFVLPILRGWLVRVETLVDYIMCTE